MKYIKKYIDVEKLIAGIKGLQCEQGFEDGMEERGYQIAIKDILYIINSLQQEQLEVNLEKEVEKFCLEYDSRKEVWFNMTPMDKKMLSNPTWSNFAVNIASHFLNLDPNARKEDK